MDLPFEPIVFGFKLPVHLILEYLAFFLAFRFYIYQKKSTIDPISKTNRLSILLGAIIGAFIGSRLFAFFENPVFNATHLQFMQLMNNKTIVGGLFGGLIGVNLQQKTGLFVKPHFYFSTY